MALAKKKRSEAMMQIPMSSMIDIVFLLLTYFIMTQRDEISEAHLAVNLPSPDGTPVETEVKQIEIQVLEGVTMLQGRAMSLEDVRVQLTAFGELDETTPVMVQCSTRARTGEVVAVLDACHGAGLSNLNLVTLDD